MVDSPSSPDVSFRQQRLLESTRLIPWEFDLREQRFTYIGPQIEPLLGYPVEAWYEPGFWPRHIHPDDQSWVPDFCLQAAHDGQDHEFEYRMLDSQGRCIWLRDLVNVVSDASGPVILQGYLLDITEEKRAQDVMEALARASSVLDTEDFLHNCVRDLARAYDARYAFIGLLKPGQAEVMTLAVWAGDRLANNFEYDLEGTPCKDVLDLKKELIPRDASRLYPSDTLLADMGVESYFGAPLIASSGKMLGLVSVMDTRPMELTRWTAPMLGVFATRISVELERKFATERLQELNQRLEERVRQRTDDLEAFTYSVSHDLRAPLRSIKGFALALHEDLAGQLNDQAQDYLGRIHQGAVRMNELIDDLLELSRLTRTTMHTESLLLDTLAQEVAEELLNRHQGPAPELHIATRATVLADPGLLRIALTNLLENALKYSRDRELPRIELNTDEHADERVFCVSDNGIGFDMARADKLFQPFQRLDNARGYPGSGVGLATVARVIHRHGGRIWADATPGEGARFYFTLGEPDDAWIP
ncbi:multi-sensor signal transduction multi-kinase [Thioalkalivibrio sulfidiphilus HL-EbGr7]|uniref:histidine kinase n=1 Tax=Thioalkalivibrio sulfidiphilus (strain HL-EbGR7) TaxID=396588 RepID=B8GPR4_THISH|nr:ATP-binding protein [Thioalkalivibrio sulfidiphilus]ACL72231.1 multi-sensor signal transduction multi-kinase [Thioalkalivibrio sulfidiphilus HL-EbGr7]